MDMEGLVIAATGKTPKVVLDPSKGWLEISGCSIHENSDKFFSPIQDRIEAYARMPARATTVRMEMSYFNSSSAKYILDILRRLEDLHMEGTSKVVLEWRYRSDDLDMQEAGSDYGSLLEFPVKLIAVDD